MRAQTRRGRSQSVKRRLSVEPLEERELLSGLNLLASSPLSLHPPSESKSLSPLLQSYSYGGTLEQPASNQAKTASENQARQSYSKPAQAAEYQKPSVAESLTSPSARENLSGNHAIVLYDDRLSSLASHSSPKPGGQAAAATEQPYFASDSRQGIANYSTQDGGQQAYDNSYSSQDAVYPSTNSARPPSSDRAMQSSPEPAAPSTPEGHQATEALLAAVQAADASKAQGQPALAVTVVTTAETSRRITTPSVRAPILANAEVVSQVPRARTVERVLAPTVEDQPAVVSHLGLATATPAPQGSNLLTGILPFDWPAVELAIQRFSDQLDNLGQELADSRMAISLASWLGGTLAVTLTFDFTRRHLRKRAALGPVPADGWNGPTSTWFPGMADPTPDG